MTVAGRITLKARKQVFTELIGTNPSRYHGEGYDFAELREYQVGDDIRHIDWVISAKLQTPYVKRFYKERQLNVTLVALMDGGIYFGSHRLKQELLAEAAALLAFGAIKNGERFSTYIATETLTPLVRPTSRIGAVSHSVEGLLAFDPVGHRLNWETLERQLMLTLHQKSLVILIGDFFTPPALGMLSKKHEVIAVAVRDHAEEEPPAFGAVALTDPGDGTEFEGVVGETAVRRWKAKVAGMDRNLAEYFRKNGVRWTKLYTHQDPFPTLARLFY